MVNIHYVVNRKRELARQELQSHAMANPEHLAILKEKGVKAWNQWRKKHPDIIANLHQADLSGANLSLANLIEADLSGVNLSRANLHQADLSAANLSGAYLTGAYLSGANLSRANLHQADLSRANLSEADLAAAHLGYTILADVDLSQTHGLDECVHGAPSSVGIDTIFKSRGVIPESFLRGAGVQDVFIAQMKALVDAMSPIQFYSCFISYSARDQKFADRLYADLQARGVRCWFAPHDMQAGKKIHEQIDEAIRVYEKLLLILSEASLNSNWVKTEIANARSKEQQQKRQMLFPITLVPFDRIRSWKLFDADTGIDSAREIREYFIPDFSIWEDDDSSYQSAFERLMRDLKSETPPPRD